MTTYSEILQAAEEATRLRKSLEQRLVEAEAKLANQRPYVPSNIEFLRKIRHEHESLEERMKDLTERVGERYHRMQALQDRIRAGKAILEELEALPGSEDQV